MSILATFLQKYVNIIHIRVIEVQSILAISTSHISNNRLSRSENLVPVLILKSKNR